MTLDKSKRPAGFQEQMTLRQKFNYLRKNVTIEPMMACFVMPTMLVNLGTQNLFLEKACRVNLGYNDTICDALTIRDIANYITEEEEVQRLVAEVAGYRAAIQSVVPCLLILFWGSWSDRHRRRKPVMLIPLFGQLLATIGLIICAYNTTWSLEWTVFAEVLFPALTGGWSTMLMGMYSYLADVTTEDERMFRMGVLTFCYQVGIPIGLSVSGILLRNNGFYTVFSLSTMFYTVALIYGTFRLIEAPALPNQPTKETSQKSFLADFFDLKHIKDTFRVAFKHGDQNRRVKIIMLMVVVMMVIGPYFGESSVFYLFTRYRFNWSEIEYSMYSTYAEIINTTGTIFSVMLLSGRLKLDDALIGICSSTSKILSSIIFGLAVSQWQMYVGSLVDVLNGTSLIAMRSIASKLVTTDELGKVNSLFGVAETLSPLMYTPLYALIYTKTLSILPGMFYLVGCGLTVPTLVIFAWFYKKSRENVDAEPIEENKPLREESKLATQI